MDLVQRIGLGLLWLLGLLLFWGVFVEPKLYRIRREEAVLPNLPSGWEGRRVAAIADFQIGMWGANTGTIRRIVRRIVDERPSAVLIAGDFVYHADGRMDETTSRVVGLIAPLLRTGIPTLAVLGNHDYSIDSRGEPANLQVARLLEASLEAAGVHVLRNEAVALSLSSAATTETSSLYVAGIDDEWSGRADARKSLAAVPREAARMVFMHNPHSFRRLPAATAPVAVAAHTHGGQIAVPFTPRWSWMALVKEQEVYADGWISEYGAAGNRLYVNVGIGFSDVPVRINAVPELTLFTLRRASRVGR